MRYKFEDLEVWQLSLKLIGSVYKIAKDFPDNERFGLTSQIKRAATSINLNIAEGSGRSTKKDFASFVRNSIGSTREVIACLRIAEQEKFLHTDSTTYEDTIQALYFKLIALDKSLRS
ncbi:MAG: four helix bundle protein [Patescibacteria group bacterium]